MVGGEGDGRFTEFVEQIAQEERAVFDRGFGIEQAKLALSLAQLHTEPFKGLGRYLGQSHGVSRGDGGGVEGAFRPDNGIEQGAVKPEFGAVFLDEFLVFMGIGELHDRPVAARERREKQRRDDGEYQYGLQLAFCSHNVSLSK